MKPTVTRKRNGILRDLLVFSGILAAAILICIPLADLFDDNNPFSAPVFILAVALIARFTSGYAWGILAAVLGVICVNYMFTFPYWRFNLSLSGYPLTFTAMLIVSVLISTLTTQVKRQEQLRSERERQRTIIALLRSVSHDLNTPLTAIIGLSRVLLDHPELEEEEKREKLRNIIRSASWLSRVSENMLSVTRFHNGNVRLSSEAQVLEEIVSGAVLRFRRFQQDIPIRLTVPEEILIVQADATLLEQVFLNLFENVVLHGKGATEIRVILQPDENVARVRVEDDGQGFTPQLLPHLFEDFTGIAEEFGGTSKMGIGLASCATIVRAHGGSITAANLPGHGAVVEFTVPLAPEEEPADPAGKT
ncbi:MAG: DUF4118 domain-containing protein [Clostridiales bacterium]|nr:DUF4118 domain-containing protein [Clostridiales bacterium]